MQCENERESEHSKKGNEDKDFKRLWRKNTCHPCTALTGDTGHNELFKQNHFVLVPIAGFRL